MTKYMIALIPTREDDYENCVDLVCKDNILLGEPSYKYISIAKFAASDEQIKEIQQLQVNTIPQPEARELWYTPDIEHKGIHTVNEKQGTKQYAYWISILMQNSPELQNMHSKIIDLLEHLNINAITPTREEFDPLLIIAHISTSEKTKDIRRRAKSIERDGLNVGTLQLKLCKMFDNGLAFEEIKTFGAMPTSPRCAMQF